MGRDSTAICCPVNGTVQRATIVTNKSDPTWEWGWYVRVDDTQGNKHYFCHCEPGSLQVKAGQAVVQGTVLAAMGNSGNAALASPPIAHVHYEVRTAGGAYLNPCDFLSIPNTVGLHGAKTAKRVIITADVLRVRTGPATDFSVLQNVQRGEQYFLLETKNGWGYCKDLGGWFSLDYAVAQ